MGASNLVAAQAAVDLVLPFVVGAAPYSTSGTSTHGSGDPWTDTAPVPGEHEIIIVLETPGTLFVEGRWQCVNLPPFLEGWPRVFGGGFDVSSPSTPTDKSSGNVNKERLKRSLERRSAGSRNSAASQLSCLRDDDSEFDDPQCVNSPNRLLFGADSDEDAAAAFDAGYLSSDSDVAPGAAVAQPGSPSLSVDGIVHTQTARFAARVVIEDKEAFVIEKGLHLLQVRGDGHCGAAAISRSMGRGDGSDAIQLMRHTVAAALRKTELCATLFNRMTQQTTVPPSKIEKYESDREKSAVLAARAELHDNIDCVQACLTLEHAWFGAVDLKAVAIETKRPIYVASDFGVALYNVQPECDDYTLITELDALTFPTEGIVILHEGAHFTVTS